MPSGVVEARVDRSVALGTKVNKRTRIILIACCAVVAIACGVSLGVLRSGRPLFYTDGTRAYRADSLADRSMLVWRTPEVRFELPGPVRGRTARLPDGRVVYARVQPDDTTELVAFDPERPQLEPVALSLLNVPERHDLAPAFGTDGRLYFASDRDDGNGGFDLYRAEYRDGRFRAPEPLGSEFNTEHDEIDPAPEPGGFGLAFVRRVLGEQNAEIWLGKSNAEQPAVRLLADEVDPAERDVVRIDRDPAFAPDGTALWFARQAAGGAPVVHRTWRHEGAFVEPVAETRLGNYRGPLPRGDGFSVELIQLGAAALVYEARAKEVYPWWEGQSALELFLWITLFVALLLIALLLLGNRWRQLDIITWCILISALLHLLILMILGGMQLGHDEPELPDDGDRLEVRFLSAGEAAGGGGGRASDVHRTIAFQGRSFQESVAAPAATVSAAEGAAPRVESGSRVAAAAAPSASVAPSSALQDTVQNVAPSQGRDASVAATAAQSTAVAAPTAAAESSVSRSQAGESTLEVGVPGRSGLARSAGVVATAGERFSSQDAPPQSALAAPSMQDAVRAERASTAAEGALAMAAPQASTELQAPTRASGLGTSRAPSRSTDLEVSRPMPSSSLRPQRPTRMTTSRSQRVASRLPLPSSSLAKSSLRDGVAEASASRPKVAKSDAPVGDSQMRSEPAPERRGPEAFSATRSLAKVGRSALGSKMPRPRSHLARAPHREMQVARLGPPTATPALYANRTGPKKQEALERFGGSEETEAAVAAGLRYLASVQRRGGYWGSSRFDHEKYGETYIGKTALCTLAFLGAGHTHKSDTEYSSEVERALRALVDTQDLETGHFGRSSAYSHGITTYALAECYAMTRDDELREPLEMAVQWILKNQNRRGDERNRGGWPYYSADLRPEDRFSRTSVSAWQIMALKSAQIGGIEFPDRALDDAKDFLWRMFDRRRGYVLYSKDPSRLNSGWRTLPASTPAAAFCLMLLGERVDTRIEDALEYVVDRRPSRYRQYSTDQFVKRGAGNVYFWYYSSLATLLAGGDVWDEWNTALKEVVLPAQNQDGSFSPIGAYAQYANDTRRDRSYTTAMIVLSLEVYYRYFTPLLARR